MIKRFVTVLSFLLLSSASLSAIEAVSFGTPEVKLVKDFEKGGRKAVPPMWYPTHATAYYVSITGGGFTEVSAVGTPGLYPEYNGGDNQHKNPFGNEIAMFKTSEGGISRMGGSWDMKDAHGEKGRVYGEKPHNNKINGNRLVSAAINTLISRRLRNLKPSQKSMPPPREAWLWSRPRLPRAAWEIDCIFSGPPCDNCFAVGV